MTDKPPVDTPLGEARYDYDRQVWMLRTRHGWSVQACGHQQKVDACHACHHYGETYGGADYNRKILGQGER